MKKFASEIGDILATVADVLQPRDFDEFVKYGFSDRPPDAPQGGQRRWRRGLPAPPFERP
jgi:internalin A